MSKKYVITSCPNYLKAHSHNYCDLDAGCCQDCIDCVMKRIYFIAKESLKVCKNCGTFIHECDGCEFNNSNVLNNILQLLNILEVE